MLKILGGRWAVEDTKPQKPKYKSSTVNWVPGVQEVKTDKVHEHELDGCLDSVKVRLDIRHGKIRCTVSGHMIDLHNDYYAKCKKPPIRKTIAALRGYGASEDIINKTFARHMWRIEHKDELDEEFNRRFPGDKKKPPAIKKALKAVIKY
jgi:hypothetical protein